MTVTTEQPNGATKVRHNLRIERIGSKRHLEALAQGWREYYAVGECVWLERGQ